MAESSGVLAAPATPARQHFGTKIYGPKFLKSGAMPSAIERPMIKMSKRPTAGRFSCFG
jgi:hypothetical protein